MNIRSKQIKIAVLALLPLFPLIPLWKKAQERKEQALARALSDEVQRRQPRLEEVKRLLAKGANVKMRVDGCDILSHAALRNTDLLALLIQKGAHINGRSYDCAEPPALWNAAQAMRVDTVRLLLKHGADPNITTLDGRTPLDFVEIMSGSGEDTQEWKAIEQALRAAGGLDSEELQKKIVKNRNR